VTSDVSPGQWAPDRLDDLVALWNVAAPDEPLTADELGGVCFDDAGVVLASPNGQAAVAAVVRTHPSDGPGPDVVVGHIRVVMVHPDARRQGMGSRLVTAAEQWMATHGASVSVLGAEAPIYLWPGVDAANGPAQCLAEAAGYSVTGSELNMALPSTFRCPAPAGVVIRRLADDGDVAAMRALVASTWPEWLVEFDLGVAAACVHGAFVDPATTADQAASVPLGFCAHSVLRTGWLGPMGTDPAHQGGGVGSALVAAVAADAMVAGLADVVISWVGPVRFYAKLGARPQRSFRSYAKVLGTTA
jgi:mycothiol synthase